MALTLGYPGRAMLQLFAVIHVILSIALVSLILMHSGRDTGFGGMGFTPASQGGTHIVEKNLTRLTVAVGLAFAGTTIWLFRGPSPAGHRAAYRRSWAGRRSRDVTGASPQRAFRRAEPGSGGGSKSI